MMSSPFELSFQLNAEIAYTVWDALTLQMIFSMHSSNWTDAVSAAVVFIQMKLDSARDFIESHLAVS